MGVAADVAVGVGIDGLDEVAGSGAPVVHPARSRVPARTVTHFIHRPYVGVSVAHW